MPVSATTMTALTRSEELTPLSVPLCVAWASEDPPASRASHGWCTRVQVNGSSDARVVSVWSRRRCRMDDPVIPALTGERRNALRQRAQTATKAGIRAVFVLGAVALLAACNGNGGGETLDEATTTSAIAPATAPGTATPATAVPGKWNAAQQAAIDTYLAFNAAYRKAASTPTQAGMDDYATAEILAASKLLIVQRQDVGLMMRPAASPINKIEPISVDVRPAEVVVTTCEVNNDLIVRIADGTVVNDKTSTVRWAITLVPVNGKSKVVGREQVRSWDGVEEEACSKM
jgi:hypothetical protein